MSTSLLRRALARSLSVLVATPLALAQGSGPLRSVEVTLRDVVDEDAEQRLELFDLSFVVTLDAAAGADVLGLALEVPGLRLPRFSGDKVADAQYVVRIGDRLALPGRSGIAFLRTRFSFSDAPELIAYPKDMATGRCTAIGDELAVPMAGTVVLIDPKDPEKKLIRKASVDEPFCGLVFKILDGR